MLLKSIQFLLLKNTLCFMGIKDASFLKQPLSLFLPCSSDQLYCSHLSQLFKCQCTTLYQFKASCHKSWLSKADFTSLIVISHKVCLCFTLCSQLTHSSWMTHTCMLSLCYDWLMFLWLTIVSHNDQIIFAHDSHYESQVSLRWRTMRTWLVLCFMIGLRYVVHWLIRVIWWISCMTHCES